MWHYIRDAGLGLVWAKLAYSAFGNLFQAVLVGFAGLFATLSILWLIDSAGEKEGKE